MPSTVRFVEARGLWRWFLRRYRFWAIPMPWGTVYCLRQHIDDPILRAHELVHIEQMQRDGRVRFCIKYLWWQLRVGYWANPYEVEAYDRSGHAVDIEAAR